jgi:hypothetical protein
VNALRTIIVAVTATLSVAQYAHAINMAEYDIDPKFSAKIVKAKAKQNATRSMFADVGADAADRESCGSQSIGNVNTGGKPGTAPREVFVFAPNAMNLVTARGCQ